ncbi:MAG: tetratricopeptide repeat protein [Chloroflexi bacterium]|nr:tetratricopeptide repeat protein [Chloroflexota bacterium]
MSKLWQRLLALGVVVGIVAVLAVAQLGGANPAQTTTPLPPADAEAAKSEAANAEALQKLAEAQATQGPATPTPQAASADAVRTRIAELEKIVASGPGNAEALIELGGLYFQIRLYPRAADTFADALKVAPDNAKVRNDLGSSLLYQGMVGLAKEEYVKAIALDPSLPDPHFNLAVVLSHSATPDIAGALAEWREVIRLAPESDLAQTSQEYIKSYEKLEAPAQGAVTGAAG